MMEENKIHWQVNGVDGNASTRPGYETMFRLPDGKAGGMIMANDPEGVACLIMIVDHIPYIYKYPFETYKKLEI